MVAAVPAEVAVAFPSRLGLAAADDGGPGGGEVDALGRRVGGPDVVAAAVVGVGVEVDHRSRGAGFDDSGLGLGLGGRDRAGDGTPTGCEEGDDGGEGGELHG